MVTLMLIIRAKITNHFMQTPADTFWFIEEENGLPPLADAPAHPRKYSPWLHFWQYSHLPACVRYIPSSHITHFPDVFGPQFIRRAPAFVAGQLSSQL
jgi:hypothetical protein